MASASRNGRVASFPSTGNGCTGKGGDPLYDLLKRHAVQVMHKAGVSLTRIPQEMKISRATGCRRLKEPAVAELPVKEQPNPNRSVGRPSMVRNFEEPIRKIFEEEPELPSVEVLHRVRQLGYTGGKSALYELMAKLRPSKQPKPMVRFEGVAGEFSQHDFAQGRVKYHNGTPELVRFFASRLKWSRWVHVVLVPGEDVESLVRALIVGFESFGGVPLVAVFDRPKTVVLGQDGDRIDWNPTFGQGSLDFRFAPELCAPASGNQKGAVENLVGWVKGSFFKVRRFHDREDMLRPLAEWHEEVNPRRPSRATNVIPAARIQEERKRLRPMPFLPAEYALRFPVFVGPTAWVDFRGYRYSMPPDTINTPATLFLYPTRVKIVVKHPPVQHPRIPPNGRVSTKVEHTAAGVAQVSGKRGKLYYQRQRLLERGEVAEAFITELVYARPRVWGRDVEQLFEMLQEVGPQALLLAMQRAHAKKHYGSEYVRERFQEKTLWHK